MSQVNVSNLYFQYITFLSLSDKTFLYKYQREMPDILHQVYRGSKPLLIIDGPPFANNDAHAGTMYNKILKSAIFLSKAMNGYRPTMPLVFDCHGLPIIWRLQKELDIIDERKLLTQANNFIRYNIARHIKTNLLLGTIFNKTCMFTAQKIYMEHLFKTVHYLNDMGYLYKDSKLIPWCIKSRSIATYSEIIWRESSHGVYWILYRISKKIHIVIYTQTLWSVPANTAIAISPYLTYSLFLDQTNNTYVILAKECIENHLKLGKLQLIREKIPPLEKYYCPITQVFKPIICDTFVSKEKGSGAVHLSGLYAEDDYRISLTHDIPLKSIINADGVYESLELGIKSNDYSALIRTLEPLLKHMVWLKETVNIKKAYYERTNSFVLYRIKEEVYININKAKEAAIQNIRKLDLNPTVERLLLKTVDDREVWCISRQKTFGTPIPLIHGTKTMCNVWPSYNLKQGGYYLWSHAKSIRRDALDIWYESGCLPFILHAYYPYPTIICEGVDQYRGFFNSVIYLNTMFRLNTLTSIFVHGYILDKTGNKMSKSKGNVLRPRDLLCRYPMDSIRISLLSCDMSKDIRLTTNILDAGHQKYKRIMNVLRSLHTLYIQGRCKVSSKKPVAYELAIYYRIRRLAFFVRINIRGMDWKRSLYFTNKMCLFINRYLTEPLRYSSMIIHPDIIYSILLLFYQGILPIAPFLFYQTHVGIQEFTMKPLPYKALEPSDMRYYYYTIFVYKQLQKFIEIQVQNKKLSSNIGNTIILEDSQAVYITYTYNSLSSINLRANLAKLNKKLLSYFISCRVLGPYVV